MSPKKVGKISEMKLIKKFNLFQRNDKNKNGGSDSNQNNNFSV